ncbi:Sirohydrochlorin ferrochelatase [Actinomadura rubteroloni]|uniref:Sirohydrochlorin ferrochelatase n=1 Tax=Actinomadura rubteroloni TaxID=1926885 RepID=A0A2P4UDE4_9ACTN|nr:sirohydrochlorin chelatase [Actinomadura rubteroloni]POM23051.1 Sirohydrochlorin ferrochelatase [Actinomadura rubteroloni]
MVAVAHGSRDPRAAATVADLLDAVRALRPDVPVHGSFLDHAPPAPERVLAGLADGGAESAVVVPLLLTAAYHSKTDIPGVLARVRRPRLRVRVAATLGPDPLILAALERRLAEAGADDPDVPVVLAVAGSRDPAANASVRALARGWPGRTAVAAFASGTGIRPDAAVAALRASGARRVAVASCFLAPGHFADRVRREAGADAVSPVLGAAPEIAELIVARYAAARAQAAPARAV